MTAHLALVPRSPIGTCDGCAGKNLPILPVQTKDGDVVELCARCFEHAAWLAADEYSECLELAQEDIVFRINGGG